MVNLAICHDISGNRPYTNRCDTVNMRIMLCVMSITAFLQCL